MTPWFYIGKRKKSIYIGVYYYRARVSWDPGMFPNGRRWFSGFHDSRKDPEY